MKRIDRKTYFEYLEKRPDKVRRTKHGYFLMKYREKRKKKKKVNK